MLCQASGEAVEAGRHHAVAALLSIIGGKQGRPNPPQPFTNSDGHATKLSPLYANAPSSAVQVAILETFSNFDEQGKLRCII